MALPRRSVETLGEIRKDPTTAGINPQTWHAKAALPFNGTHNVVMSPFDGVGGTRVVDDRRCAGASQHRLGPGGPPKGGPADDGEWAVWLAPKGRGRAHLHCRICEPNREDNPAPFVVSTGEADCVDRGWTLFRCLCRHKSTLA